MSPAETVRLVMVVTNGNARSMATTLAEIERPKTPELNEIWRLASRQPINALDSAMVFNLCYDLRNLIATVNS
jgi:hypothetical protein